jgi:WD40 repeat protein
MALPLVKSARTTIRDWELVMLLKFSAAALCLFALLQAALPTAWAQTIDGDILRGQGKRAEGAGWYNLSTAKANAINVNAMRNYNEEVRLNYRNMVMSWAEKRGGKKLSTEDAQKRAVARLEELRNNPSSDDIRSGEAINVLVAVLSDPDIDPKNWHDKAVELPEGATIKDIVFHHYPKKMAPNEMKVLVSLSRLGKDIEWPIYLNNTAFDAERKGYVAAVSKVKQTVLSNKFEPSEIKALTSSLDKLKAKIDSSLDSKGKYRLQGKEFHSELTNATKLFDADNIDWAKYLLQETDQFEATTVEQLIAFMRQYRLMFAAADSPRSTKLYNELFLSMKKQASRLEHSEALLSRIDPMPEERKSRNETSERVLKKQSDSKDKAALALKSVFSPEAASLRANMVQTAKQMDNTDAGARVVQQLHDAKWPLDLLERSSIPKDELIAAGSGDANAAQSELVAVIGSSRWKSSNQIVAIDASPNREALVSAARNGFVTVWNPMLGTVQNQILVCDSDLNHVKLNRNGSSFLTADSDRKVKLWQVERGKQLQVFEGHKGAAWAAVFSSDEKSIYSIGDDSQLRVWKVSDGTCEKVIEISGMPVTLASHPSKATVAVSTQVGSVIVVNVATGEIEKELSAGVGRVSSVDFSPNGKYLAASLLSGEVTVWQVNNNYEVWKQKASVDKLKVFSIRFAKDSAALAIGDAKRLLLWGFESEGFETKDTVHGSAIGVLPFGNHWLVGWNERWISAYDGQGKAMDPASGPIMAAAVSPDGTAIAASARQLEKTQLWKLVGQISPLTLKGNGQWDTATCFSLDGRMVFTGGGNWVTKVWDIQKAQQITSFKGHTNWISSVDSASDGKRICSSAGDSTSRIWEIQTGKEILVVRGHKGPIVSSRFSPDASKLLTAGRDGYSKVWDSKTGSLLLEIPKSNKPVLAAAFRPFSDELASTDGSVVNLHSNTGDVRRSLVGHMKDVEDLDFNLDGSLVATSSQDGSVRIWNASTGEQFKSIQIHPRGGTIGMARFTPDGRHVITLNANGTCYVLRLAL